MQNMSIVVEMAKSSVSYVNVCDKTLRAYYTILFCDIP